MCIVIRSPNSPIDLSTLNDTETSPMPIIPKKKDAYAIQWTSKLIETLLEGLVKQKRLDRRPESAYKPETYRTILADLQPKITQRLPERRYLQITKDKIKAKVFHLKDL